MAAASVVLRRREDGFHTGIGWLDSHHSFSFGPHYDPANTHFGLLLVHNDDTVAGGAGFQTHPHRDMEIVTWVLEGQLVHQDSHGNSGIIHPGLAQRMSAGSGILHSEKNDAWRLTGEPVPAQADPVHFIQMWVLPDERGIAPGYEQLDVSAELGRGGLVVVASGMPEHRDDAAIRLNQRHAGLHAARLEPAAAVQLPDAPLLHLSVVRGGVDLEGVGPLAVGDSARITDGGGVRVVAGAEPTEILVWEMHAGAA